MAFSASFYSAPEEIEATAADRSAVLDRLKLTMRPVPEFDTIAHDLAGRFDVDFAMVNMFFDAARLQYFAGYADRTESVSFTTAAPTSPPSGQDERAWDYGLGWSTRVMNRPDTVLPLPAVTASARYHSNPAQAKAGISAYIGLRITFQGVPIGTVCAVDRKPRDWSDADVEHIKETVGCVGEILAQRAARLG